jgi:NADPH-dependent 2,4-dienoyl-CoA reductase/sulfur reductase-like enzyme
LTKPPTAKSPPTQFNRYLIRMDTRSLGHLYTDCLVIGGGVAGMLAALQAAQAGKDKGTGYFIPF